ncbi:MAG: 4-hydroxy-3-methylbut-2-enyl diphosphate reductase [Abditibacteriales bacterium]|nr:4-hydroxy-3-methylbut-2-enyl diphosphate reductase [Abditibacteriales bacterium]MDW8366819.1 4-hydroxy-3-methylbut-2-enyl diphosphate reductase [Abditibacteriales bacterium]
MGLKKVVLVKPRGFCAGVVRAIEIVDIALKTLPHPIYVRKEIVHNKHVVEGFRQRGAIFVDSLDEVPDGAICIFSAHGVSPQVRAEAERRGLKVIDATCPLVTKVHLEAIRFAREGYSLILIGHNGHEEVEGTMGEAPMQLVETPEDVERLEVPNPDKVVYLTQTTLSVDDTQAVVDALRKKFPHLTQPPKDDICYATQNRQSAVKTLAQHVDLIFVIGSQNSSNSQRLKEVAQGAGVRAYLIEDETKIDPAWLDGVESVGITAGASAPESLVESVVNYLCQLGATEVEEIEAIEEDVHFALPAELKQLKLI